MPTAITGSVPHAARSEDSINGYRIPAGATIVLGVWSCNNDPQLFDDPRTFNPARHNLNLSVGQAAVAADMKDKDMWTFGAGRRICPGLHVAERSLFLAIARLLWTFNIAPAKHPDGTVIDIDPDEVTQSLAARPVPFRFVIPRQELESKLTSLY